MTTTRITAAEMDRLEGRMTMPSTEETLIASLADEIAGEAKRIWGASDRIYSAIEYLCEPGRELPWRAAAYSLDRCEQKFGTTAAEAARLLLDRLRHMAPRVGAREDDNG